ncbi:outer membrane protein [Rhodovulum imhoffii]|uniref:Outer membrane protein n=1 Tax=Rhodovulum imhoffii TaxID=365340 RepID=A0A2T5BWM1_9RHOB|nr:OmpW family outer membrane protein [Rhodovulum imhoffii]MBK5935045.1 hypothetical protein [Rhodovulum imhoffii]PTN03990.1 outer membrane protein [Rhodovulum imhoffii]
MPNTITLTAAALASALALAPMAQAQSAGDFTLGIGLIGVMPKSDNGDLAGFRSDVQDSVRPSITFEYFVRENIGIEVLGALPFEHDIKLGGVEAASTKHLPPTVSLQYHFANASAFTPFLGAGINYTTFFEEDSPLGDLSIDDSWGLALHAGFDYAVSDTGAFRADVRWIDINSDVKLEGDKIGDVDIDPFTFGVSYIHRF